VRISWLISILVFIAEYFDIPDLPMRVIVFSLLQLLVMLVMVWIGVVAFIGLTKKREEIPESCSVFKNRFAIVVCAHNEEKVISSLLTSIGTVDYPHDKIHVFLLADHCTDATAEIAAKFPFVTVFHRDSGPTNGKGNVLSWGIPLVLEHGGFDAFAFFDADNVLKPDFLTQMNKMLNNDNKIIQGNRLGGKPYLTIVTKWYSLYWACYSTFFSYAREKVGLSAFLTGTGFVVKRELLEENNWNTNSITEDVEFSVQNIIKGNRVAFCRSAVCYDEQPSSMKVMFKQLSRWCTGGYQILGMYILQLLRCKGESKLKRLDAVMLLLMGPCSWIIFILSIANTFMLVHNTPLTYHGTIIFNLLQLAAMYIPVRAVAKYNDVDLTAMHIPMLTFPLFLFFYMLCSIKACFKPTVKWEKIEHKSIEQITHSDKAGVYADKD